MTDTTSRCPGCGLAAPDGPQPPPPTYRASSGCWARFGELLARSYADPEYRAVHQLVVDAYVAQHPGDADPQQVRRLALCLMTLELFVDHGHDVTRGPELHQRMVASLPELHVLDRPDAVSGMTVEDVLAAGDAVEHRRLVRAWAAEVWQAWRPHHDTVRRWNREALG